MHIFTSVTSNYIPKARVLAHSIKKYHPEAHFSLILSDKIPDWLTQNEPFDDIITSDQLGIPNFKSWLFKHSLVEMCTAVKGFAFQHIIKKYNATKIFYFDPDIAIFSRLDCLLEKLDSNDVLLTPHQATPEIELRNIIDNEICSLKHGVFNLGFLGIHAKNKKSAFIDWWTDRLKLFCYDDIPGGLFTDQRWVDLAPCFFNNIKILRDPQYNVSTWNISHRKVSGSIDSKITVNKKPLCFYHFSGFDSGAQEIMLGVYGKNNPTLLALREWYISECDKMGQKDYGRYECFYHRFDNEKIITKEHRMLYRNRQDLQDAFPEPFATSDINISYCDWYKQNAQPQTSASDNNPAQELYRIKNSRSWKLMTFLKKIYHTILPV